MSLRAAELTEVVDELSTSLVGAVLQRAFAPEPGLTYLELRYRGRTVLLCLSVARERARISIAQERQRSTGPAHSFQHHIRRELVGSILAGIAREGERVVALDFRSGTRSRRLIADFTTRDGKLILLAENGRIVALSSEIDVVKSGLRPGAAYQPPIHHGEKSSASASRLAPAGDALFPFAQAAEALYAKKDSQQRVEEIRRRLVRTLKAKLERILRTREKVLAEASRQPEAERHRRMGELISQNLHRIRRGEKSVRLTEYAEVGPTEVEVPLHPERTPKQQAEWHFHQYRRLLRGSERASERLAQLEAEAQEARRALEETQSASDEELLERGEASSPPRRKSPPKSRPYKEYFSSTGQRIWVGRDSRSNDELTFRIARPEDLWLHARGASGSHVVVPLEKNADPSSELLVDAAHLALHHSGLKGEPRGEVVYARAKHVRRRKGDPAGAVSVVRDKTLVVRVEPKRLEKLLGSRTRSITN